MAKRRILLIYTGGTIGSERDAKSNTYVVKPSPDHLLEQLSDKHKNLFDNLEVDVITPTLLMSEDIVPADWEDLAAVIVRRVNEYVKGEERVHGVIVTHGTDTMSYTATALSFLLHNLGIPVVLTGASYPPDFVNSDAISNLHAAFITALEAEHAGVFLAFRSENQNECIIHLGSRVQQIQPFEISFTSIHNCAYATIGLRLLKNRHFDYGLSETTLPSVERPLPRMLHRGVRYLRVYPGFRPDNIQLCVDQGTKALVLETYHSATFCTRRDSVYDLLPALRAAREEGVYLLFSHLLNGNAPGSDPEYKSPLIMFDELEATPLHNMTMEAMLLKTMWALGIANDEAEFKDLMNKNQVGEICKKNQGRQEARTL